ncbi:MAG TPA: ketopantoate reductase family protein [Candidatus Margulisiibacteriota bacterium]|nr:ketopantoate reductase family protein [Candidatus Margulisiibacteriota bacterium]
MIRDDTGDWDRGEEIFYRLGFPATVVYQDNRCDVGGSMTPPYDTRRILVAGAGALGLVFGALLRRAGHVVTLLGRAVHTDAVVTGGVHVEGLWGEHVATGFELATDATQLHDRFDAVLVTVKSYDTRAVGAAVAPFLAPDGVLISLQNGLGNVEALSAAAGASHVLAGRVIFGAEVVAAGRVRVTVYADPVLIGVWRRHEHPLDAAAKAWAERFAAAGIPSAYSDDIEAALWGKVLYNAALNPLGALLGVHYGALGEDANTRAVMDAVIDEAFCVAVAEHVALPWASAAHYRALFYDRLLPSTFRHRPSMLQDLERGHRTEIEAINGEVWKRGTSHGLRTPANELLTRLILARTGMRGGSGV